MLELGAARMGNLNWQFHFFLPSNLRRIYIEQQIYMRLLPLLGPGFHRELNVLHNYQTLRCLVTYLPADWNRTDGGWSISCWATKQFIPWCTIRLFFVSDFESFVLKSKLLLISASIWKRLMYNGWGVQLSVCYMRKCQWSNNCFLLRSHCSKILGTTKNAVCHGSWRCHFYFFFQSEMKNRRFLSGTFT